MPLCVLALCSEMIRQKKKKSKRCLYCESMTWDFITRFFPLSSSPVGYRVSVAKQKVSHYTETLGVAMMHEEDLEEE